MRRHYLRRASLAVAVAAVYGCEGQPTDPADRLSAVEAQLLGAELAAASGVIIDMHVMWLHALVMNGPPGEPRTASASFSRTAPCPEGGEIRIEGEMQRTVDREARTMTVHSVATTTHVACVSPLRARRDGAAGTITINGNPNLRTEAHRAIVAGELSGPQTMEQAGSFTWSRSTGESGVCDVDISSVFDPATRTRTVTGTFCGHDVSRTITPPAGRG
jgi:hypothetical protein